MKFAPHCDVCNQAIVGVSKREYISYGGEVGLGKIVSCKSSKTRPQTDGRFGANGEHCYGGCVAAFSGTFLLF